ELQEIKRMFTPEFRNRLDSIISFASLDENIILRVVDKFLMQLEEQLHEKKVEAIFTDDLRRHLAKSGFDPLMGARPMQRLIQDTIRKALADELLFGKLANGGKVTVDVDDKDEVQLTYTESSPPDGEGEPKVEAELAYGRSSLAVPRGVACRLFFFCSRLHSLWFCGSACGR